MDLQSWIAGHPRAGLMIYSTLGTAAVAVVLLTNWPTYHHIIRGGPPVLWYYIAVVAVILPIVFAEPAFSVRFLREHVFWWMLVFVLSGTIWLLLAQDYIDWATLTWNTRLAALGMFCSITILAAESNKRLVAFVMMLCVAFACATIWYDVLRPYTFVPQGSELAHAGRGAGLFINPNVAASFIAMTTLVALPFLPMRLRSWAILGAAIGVLPTFSRSGSIYVAILLIGPALLGLLNRAQILILAMMVPVLVATAVLSFDFLMAASDNPNLHRVVQRLGWFGGEPEGDDEATAARLYGAEQAWQMFLSDPILGQGIGATRVEPVVQEGPHNMYLMFMAEQGFFGMALYPLLIAIIALRGWQLAKNAMDKEGREIGKAAILYATFLLFYGLFSHNVLEEPHGMFVMAFLMAAAFRVRYGAEQRAWAPAANVQRPSSLPNIAATKLRQS